MIRRFAFGGSARKRAREELPGGFAAIAITIGLVFVIAMLLNALL